MKCIILCALFPLAAVTTPSQDDGAPQRIALWAGDAPGALGTAEDVQPTMVAHLCDRSRNSETRPAIVVCPGGGYHVLAMDHEGVQIAAWLNSLEINAIVLEYRHKGNGYRHPTPRMDAQRAMRLVRHHAQDWHIDPTKVGILGFSAGGHLASSVSVHHDAGDPDAVDPVDRLPCRPDFAVLSYPVIAMGQEFAHKGSQRNLLGPNPSAELLREMSTDRHVSESTPPTFLWHTSEDTVVSAQNSVAYYLALLRHRVPCELHIFEHGRHGVGLGAGLAAGAWPELCRRWLVGRGVLEK